MMRTYDFENDFCPKELAEALRDAGFPGDTTLAAIISGSVEDVDDEVTLTLTLGEDELLDELTDEAITNAYHSIADRVEDDRALEDAIRYARNGHLSLSLAMFSRVYEGGDLDVVRRALS
ncbi:hypothetical protein [Sphingomonas sp.]|uniref:hypothetical protein n=1 Tax=Sphingomonas sp. TaxID=28214 RepID=UPI0035B2C70A